MADKQNPVKGMGNYRAKRPLHQFERDNPITYSDGLKGMRVAVDDPNPKTP